MPVHIDILDIRGCNAHAGGIVCQVRGTIGIAKLGNANGHTLALETLLIELIDLVCRCELIARQRLLRSILATIAGKSGSMCCKAEWRLELGESKVIQANNRGDEGCNRIGEFRIALL